MINLQSRSLYMFARGAVRKNRSILKKNRQHKGNNVLRILSFFILLSLVFTTGVSDAYAAKKKSKGNPKYASIVMDADTGVILSQRYADKVLHPASLTKIMTLLMAFEALDRGDIQLNDRIRMSRHAANMVPSKLGIPAGSSIRVKDAILALVTKSANDVAVAVAEHIGGSESKFASLMTQRARTIGMNSTRFKNASGLHNKYQVSTARDMAKLGRYILQRYPHYYKYFSTKSFTYKGKTYRSHNRLMNSYKGMDGFKTGYINASGFNLVASAYRDGRRLIGVVFGGRTSKSRNAHMAQIMDLGFDKASKIRMAKIQNPPIPKQKPVYGLASMNAGAGDIKIIPAKQNPTTRSSFTSLASLNSKTRIKSQKKPDEITPNYTALSEALQEGAFSELIGEGDFDPSVSKRLETGLIAVAVHKGDYQPSPEPASAVEKSLRHVGHAMIAKWGDSKEKTPAKIKPSITDSKSFIAPQNKIPTLPHPKDIVGKWSVQIGAFNSRVATDEALQEAVKKLPKKYSKATPMAVPLRTAEGLIFRARLGGLEQKEAKKVCKYFKDCMPVAPISTMASAQ